MTRAAAPRNPARRSVLLAGLVALGSTVLSGSQAAAVPIPTVPIPTVPAPDRVPAPAPAVGMPASGSFRSVRAYPEVPPPVRLLIPELQVDTPLERLGQAPDRTIQVPTDFGTAGWFADGPQPGQAGPAVILGHVDSASGPAVFFRLAGIAAGTGISVQRADGSTVAFRVTGVQHVRKDRFPTLQVYGASLAPSLRLVTCGGRFDRARESYEDNVIVYADLAA